MVDAANAWLPRFVEDYNTRFGRAPANVKNLHRPLTEADDLDEILAWREERRGHSFAARRAGPSRRQAHIAGDRGILVGSPKRWRTMKSRPTIRVKRLNIARTISEIASGCRWHQIPTLWVQFGVMHRDAELAAIEAFLWHRLAKIVPARFAAPGRSALPLPEERRREKHFWPRDERTQKERERAKRAAGRRWRRIRAPLLPPR